MALAVLAVSLCAFV